MINRALLPVLLTMIALIWTGGSWRAQAADDQGPAAEGGPLNFRVRPVYAFESFEACMGQ